MNDVNATAISISASDLANRILSESKITLGQVADVFPGGRDNKRTHPSTVLRWILRGAKSSDGQKVRLEAIRAGSRWLTSHEAVARFVASLTSDTTPVYHSAISKFPSSNTTTQQQRACEKAAKELEKLGC